MTSPTTTRSTRGFGTLGDFVEMIRTASSLGIRVLVDLPERRPVCSSISIRPPSSQPSWWR